jgi:hypothetical protein
MGRRHGWESNPSLDKENNGRCRQHTRFIANFVLARVEMRAEKSLRRALLGNMLRTTRRVTRRLPED